MQRVKPVRIAIEKLYQEDFEVALATQFWSKEFNNQWKAANAQLLLKVKTLVEDFVKERQENSILCEKFRSLFRKYGGVENADSMAGTSGFET